MNPISGTYRYPMAGPTLQGIMEFLADTKEKDELYMVVDEELKMMARFCPEGGRVIGPYLKEMSRLAHTEYLIEGRTTADPRKILLDTLFAPTGERQSDRKHLLFREVAGESIPDAWHLRTHAGVVRHA